MIPIFSVHNRDRIRDRFKRLYPDYVDQAMERVHMMIGRYGVGLEPDPIQSRWSEKDVVLITYGDMVRGVEGTPLASLRRFATRHLVGAISTIHILPFYPSSSDDGFSVVNYRAVDPQLGDWRDVTELGNHFQLMFDLVLNHCSAKSGWLKNYQYSVLPYLEYFIEASPETDLSAVVRPRTSPLLTPVHTRNGQRHLWTTFSADQIDLNWSNPNVFFEMLDLLLFYISQGARIIRLDAVAFLWKEIGTPCLHHPLTHEVVKLFRDILALAAPNTIILTETNVPHEENLSYFGEGDEAHMVYQFALPALLLHGLLRGTARHLTRWTKSLPTLPPGLTFFNFTASHDGIGVRPLQDLLDKDELRYLITEVEARGGRISYKLNSDGSSDPYELNITYYSALTETNDPNSELSGQRFLCSQLVALSLQGLPAIYFHSLTASPNDFQGAAESGIARRINRHRFDEDELSGILENADGLRSRIFHRYVDILRRRASHPAFHPEAPQRIIEVGDSIFGLIRTAREGTESVICLHNFAPTPSQANIGAWFDQPSALEIITDSEWERPDGPIELAPHQVVWLRTKEQST